MSSDNPWSTRASRIIYKNEWISLREDDVVRPDGKDGIYSVVDTRIAVGILALTEKNEIYLVGQYRYPTEHYSWEIVEGGTDPGEDPLETAKRELQEEAGLIASHWQALGEEVHLSNCISSEVAVFYLARGLSETESNPDGTEVLEVRRVPFEESVRMVDSGEIKDAMSIIAILRANRKLF